MSQAKADDRLTVTELVAQLKAELEAIASNLKPPQTMSQNYSGFLVSEDHEADSTVVKNFIEDEETRLVSSGDKRTYAAGIARYETTSRGTQLNKYPNQALQAAWNFADILGTAMTYTPCEWTAGVVRGLIATGPNGKRNGDNLQASLDYLDPDSQIPYIIDETTYAIGEALKKFMDGMEKRGNGKSLISHLDYTYSKILDREGFSEYMKNTLASRLEGYEENLVVVKNIDKKAEDDSSANTTRNSSDGESSGFSDFKERAKAVQESGSSDTLSEVTDPEYSSTEEGENSPLRSPGRTS